MRLLSLTERLAYGTGGGSFLDTVSAVTWQHRLLVVVLAGALAGSVGWWLKQGPGGHGGELTAAIWFHAGRLSPLTVVVRALLSIVIVGLGASLGREAAPKQIGALLASLSGVRAGLTPPERRLLVACGAGAGMAAVYNVPLGGALFALEVLLGTLSLPLVAPALLTSAVATVTSWLLLPMRPTYDLPTVAPTAGVLVWSLLLGPLAGLASVLFTRAVCWADRRKPRGWHLLAAPLGVFAVLGVLGIWLPALLGNGKDVVQLALQARLDLPMVASLLLLKPVLTAASLGSGAPGGLFTPTLAYGALLGALAGQAWTLLWPDGAAASYALIGAGAVLAGTTLGPVSAVVMLLELTHGAAALLAPLMLAAGGAVVVARALDPRSIYSGRIHQAARLAGAGTLSSAARLPEVLTRLIGAGTGHRLTVIDETGKPVGTLGLPGAAHVAGQGSAWAIVTAADLARAAGPER